MSSIATNRVKTKTKTKTKSAQGKIIQPSWVRIVHWINAVAIFMMIGSGWQIYNASPLFKTFTFSGAITLGGWLGGALQWHFAAMWLLVLNGLIYLALNVSSGRLARKFFPLAFGDVWHDLRDALRGQLSHADPRR